MVEACVRTESLRVGLSESVFPDHDPGGGYNPGSRHCHPDLRGFPQLQPHLHVLFLKIYEVDPPHFFQLATGRRWTTDAHNMRGAFPLDSQGKTQ
jgi:hypothetical protein